MGFSRWFITTFPMPERMAERYADRIERRYGTNIRNMEPAPDDMPVRSPRRRWR